MKQLVIFLFIFSSYWCVFCQTQTTVTFKPGPLIGQDAMIRSEGDCILNIFTKPANEINFGNYQYFLSMAWTFDYLGCPSGTLRSLIKFTELASIPTNAVIVGAELKLFGITPNTSNSGNSCYPDSPYSSGCPNSAFIRRVTSVWDEQTVTWNTQPTTTTINQITIFQTTSQWNWNFSTSSDNLVAMVQDMVSNPITNNGFMILLEIESFYRCVVFASSNHSNPDLWPQLSVTYEIPYPTPTFYANDIEHPDLPLHLFCTNTIAFRAEVISGSHEFENLRWFIDGSEESSAQNQTSWSKTFPAGTYDIELQANLKEEPSVSLKSILNIGANISTFASPNEGGSVVGDTCVFVGNQVNVAATPHLGYRFVNWTENETPVSSNPDYAFTATKNRALVAHFTLLSPDTLDFDNYAVIICDRVILLNLRKLADDGYIVTDCKWFRDGKEVKNTHTLNQFSFAEGSNKRLFKDPTYYMYQLTTSNYGELPSSKKIIIHSEKAPGCPETEDLEELLVYPNPVLSGSLFTIEGLDAGNQIQVYNPIGTCVYSTIATDYVMTLSFHFPPGIYLIRTGDKMAKVVVIK